MLRFEITEDGREIRLVHYDLNMERSALFSYFKKKSKAAAFNVMVDRGLWDGLDHFITKNGRIKIGLWKELLSFSEKHGIDCDIPGLEGILNTSLKKETYLKWVENLLSGVVDERGEPIMARDYQIEGAYRAIKYRFCTQELATSAGKTLIFYLYNSFLRDGGRITPSEKSLIIVPNVSLVGQTAEKFELYSVGKRSWSICVIGGNDRFDQETFDRAEVVISTYQSLQNLPKEIFESFSVINIDECHKSRGNVIRQIINSCKNWKYRLGLSGTVKLEEEFSDYFRVQESVGPLVMVLPATHLIEKGYSPNVQVNILDLEYDPNDEYLKRYWDLKANGLSMYKSPKDFGREMLNIERGFIFESQARLDAINHLVQRLGQNTLILFSDIKNEYGKRIQQRLLEWNPDVFYIDGEVKSDDRDRFKAAMESKDGVVIVASFGTFSTGIDLKRVYHIVFAESTKAEITIRQSIGRGMRKLAEKTKVVIWDLVDRLDGYTVKHGKRREEIYREQGFPIKRIRVDLSRSNQR